MRWYICGMFIIVSLSLFGAWDWADSIGGAGMDRIWDISCDTQSNIFVAGDFVDTLWVQGTPYPGFGLSDSFVIKYSPNGEVLWAKSFGSTSEDVALGVSTDAAGNCYVGGYFVDTFSCESQSQSSLGMWDVYVLKLDPMGNLLWLRTFGGSLNDIGYGLCVSPAGRVYVAGWFADTIKFPGGASIVSAGGSDVFCSAWETDGSFAWAKRAGTAGVEYGYEVACDAAGNAYVTGVASVGSQFENFILPTDGMFVCKYNSMGNAQWLASSLGAGALNIAVQPESGENQYGMACGRITGVGTIGNFAFNTVDGSSDAYWAKFDAETGTWIDMQYYGGTALDKGKDCDCAAYPAFLASFEEQANFGGFSFTSQGGEDIMLAQGALNSLHWTHAGGQNNDVPTSVKILPNGKVAIAGWHFGALQFGMNAIDSGEIANQNGFVACLDPQSSVEEQLNQPQNVRLSPNPFVDQLSIHLDKALSPAAQIQVYNLKGQIIRSLSPTFSKGTEDVYTWDGRDAQGRNCSSGIYLFKGKGISDKALKLK